MTCYLDDDLDQDLLIRLSSTGRARERMKSVVVPDANLLQKVDERRLNPARGDASNWVAPSDEFNVTTHVLGDGKGDKSQYGDGN
jgi:hypothetical protein